MPHLCIVVSGEGRWRVEQHSQHIGLDVADTGSVVAQALEHILDVQAVDLLEALMDQLDGIFLARNEKGGRCGAEDFHHQADDFIQAVFAVFFRHRIVSDLRFYGFTQHAHGWIRIGWIRISSVRNEWIRFFWMSVFSMSI